MSDRAGASFGWLAEIRRGRRLGFRRSLGIAFDRVLDHLQDRWLGIRAGRFLTTEALAIARAGNHDYAATSVRAFRKFMRCLDAEAFEGVFVDYGSGLGRVLALAAEYPFERVLGVELSHRLAAESRRQLSGRRRASRGRVPEVWVGEADHFPVPSRSTVLYFFNPFHGPVLERVFDRIAESWRSHPRVLHVIFNNPVHFDSLRPRHRWLEPWAHFDLEYPCVIYRADPDGPA